MLVLSRKRDESIRIGDDVRIMLLEIRGDKARIGIEAPKQLPVHRDEVARRIAAEGSRRPVVQSISLAVMLESCAECLSDWHDGAEKGDLSDYELSLLDQSVSLMRDAVLQLGTRS